MNKFKDFFSSKKPVAVIGLLFACFFLYTNLQAYFHLKYFSVYGIAECTEIDTQNSNSYAMYEFYVGSKKIEGATYLDGKIYPGWVGKHFKVQYSSKDPKINEIFLDKPVYDTVRIKKAGFVIKVQEKKEKRNQFRD
ncbi:hypothetical protein [Cellulophaga baltica]|uniref:hypothetical protein n=1 Tax=Cellulophaga baltica TaxID=76594 RepID=UPI00046F5505|nr:hypothetical protein [Cellulophaga baltica]AIY13803.1 hypothetical protein M667_11585 [Cellulophaga baltica NN016038]